MNQQSHLTRNTPHRYIRWTCIAAAASILMSTVAQAQFTYSIENETVTIVEFDCSSSIVEIPTIIDGFPVTTIGERAFTDCNNLISVQIPDSVTTIEKEAFNFCTGLVSVTLPPSVVTIGDKAFFHCESLTSVVIPDGVISIGDNAFQGCYNLPKITIPASVVMIGGRAFNQCDSLTAINVHPSNPVYKSIDGILFDTALTTLIRYPQGRVGSYAIASGTVRIEGRAFSGSAGLTNIEFPESIAEIGGSAFSGCISLEHVSIPNRITRIDGTFTGCTSLRSVELPAGLERILHGAFSGCSSLIEVVIPNSVTFVGWDAFSHCTSLRSVTFGTGLETIYDSAFAYCTSLTQLTIPDSVNWISRQAFRDCVNLIEVTIGRGVTDLGNYAFLYCSGLKNVYFKGNAPDLEGDHVFLGADNVTVRYVEGTSGWGSTFGGRPTVVWIPPMPPTLSNPHFAAGLFTFSILGTTDETVSIEAAGDPANGSWIQLESVTLQEGAATFTDAEWAAHTRRFYRVRSQ